MHTLIYNAKLLEKINVQELQLQIKHNDANAMFHAGMLYHQGIQTKADPEKGIKWLTKAAGFKHKDAAYNLGLIYLLGLGATCNILKGRDYLEMSAKCGRTDLYPLIKRIDDRYFNTKYQAPVFDKSLLNPRQPDPHDEREGNWRYVPKQLPDINKVIGIIILAAAFIVLFISIALIMRSGGDNPFPVMRALFIFLIMVVIAVGFFWVRKPREKLPTALKKVDYTESYLTNEDVFNNQLLTEDISDLEYLANHKDSEAMYKMGYMYYKGIQLPQDYIKAASWHQRAAMLRHPSATYAAGMMYLRGQGVKFNLTKGLDLLEMAASYGHEEAKNTARRIRRAYQGQKLSEVEFEPGLLDTTAVDVIHVTQRLSFKLFVLFCILFFVPSLIMKLFGGFLYAHAKIIFYPIAYLVLIRPLLIALLIVIGIIMLRDAILRRTLGS